MQTLALDACMGAVSAAVHRDDGATGLILAEAYEERTTGHAERLMPLVDGMLAQAGLGYRDIDRIAVTHGPGSFTGVRVGVAAARALALATGKPAIGVSSLAAIAHEARTRLGAACEGQALAVAVDARGGAVFFQLFSASGPVSEPALATPDDAAAAVERCAACVVVGSAAAAVVGLISDAGRFTARLPELQPAARSVAVVSAGMLPTTTVQPLYLRRPDAKPQGNQSLPRALS